MKPTNSKVDLRRPLNALLKRTTLTSKKSTPARIAMKTEWEVLAMYAEECDKWMEKHYPDESARLNKIYNHTPS